MKNVLPTSTFDLFPDLLPELRLEIWAHALPPPQIIELALLNRVNSRESPFRVHYSPASGPASTWNAQMAPEYSLIRLVNHEARQVFLSHYSRTFTRDDPILMRGMPVWIDYRRDTVYLSKSTFVNKLIHCITGEKVYGKIFPLHIRPPFDFSKIRYIAAEWPPLGAFHSEGEVVQMYESPQFIAKDLGLLFELCPKLEEYAIVVDGRDMHFAWEEEFTADAEGRFPDLRSKWSGRLVDATAEKCEEGGVIVWGRSMLMPCAFAPLVEAVRKQIPGLKIPELKMKLFVNGRCPEKARRWDLLAGTCSLMDDINDADDNNKEWEVGDDLEGGEILRYWDPAEAKPTDPIIIFIQPF